MFHNNSPWQVLFRPPATSDLPYLAAGGEKRDLPIVRVDLSVARQFFAVKRKLRNPCAVNVEEIRKFTENICTYHAIHVCVYVSHS